MRKYLLLLAFIPMLVFAQSERFTVGLSSGTPDANTHTDKMDYALNIGAHIELQRPHFYLRLRSFYFPQLNDLPYFDVDGGVGFNYRNPEDDFRIFLGGFTGLISRDKAWHPKFGVEFGFDWYSTIGIFLGVRGDIQQAHDDKVWLHNESGHERRSANFVIGYSWYYE